MVGTPVRIFLTRHAETEWNVEGRWQGQADSPLTPRGLEQARALAAALAGEPIQAVYCSDSGRAMATAREVARPHRLEPIPWPGLREIDCGRWTGQLGRDLRLRCPAELERWAQRPYEHQMPGGETLRQVQARALAFFAERMPVHTMSGGPVVVIGHGTINNTLLVAAMQRPLTDLWLKDRVENCQISRLEWTPSGGLRLVELCDLRHLDGAMPRGARWRALGMDEDSALQPTA